MDAKICPACGSVMTEKFKRLLVCEGCGFIGKAVEKWHPAHPEARKRMRLKWRLGMVNLLEAEGVENPEEVTAQFEKMMDDFLAQNPFPKKDLDA